MIQQMSIHQYLENLSGASATPGGGAVAALTLAQAAALLSMVCAYTIGREKYKAAEEQIREIMQHAHQVQQRSMKATDEDSKAYEQVLIAYRLPANTQAQIDKKNTEIRRKLEEAAAIPWSLFELCEGLFEKAVDLRPICNPNLVSDVDVALCLLQSAAASLWINTEINLKTIQDLAYFKDWRSRAAQVLLKLRSVDPKPIDDLWA